MFKVSTNKLGFKFINPTPSKKQLDKFYFNKYFKKTITYKDKFKKIENSYYHSISLVQIFMLKNKIKNLSKKNLLDLGAGQGTFLLNVQNFFKTSLGIDYSFENLSSESKSKINFISMSPENFIKKNLKKYDIITLNNVLEHVSNPIKFMKTLKKNIKKNTYIMVVVPNDFSYLQQETNKRVRKKNYWLLPPEHLNYFNKENFKNFSNKIGFNVVDAIADFPIELFLLKKDFDYTKNPTLGKKIHLLRCEIMSYLVKNNSISKVYEFLKLINQLNIGRNNYFLLKKNRN